MVSWVEIEWKKAFTERADHIDKVVRKALDNQDKDIFWCGLINRYPAVARLLKQGKVLKAASLEIVIKQLVHRLRMKHWMFGARPVIVAASRDGIDILTLNLFLTRVKKTIFFPIKETQIEIVDIPPFLVNLSEEIKFLVVSHNERLECIFSITDIKRTEALIEYIKKQMLSER